MRNFRLLSAPVAVLSLIILTASFSRQSSAAGVTIITHGLQSDIDDWVIAMAGAVPGYYRYPGTEFVCYEIAVTNGEGITVSARKLGGGAPSENFSGEILIKLDWRGLANNSYSTYQVASAVVPRLLQTNFIAELGGHALAELPLHLVGHSRGGSLVCELSRQLGTNGAWVDHLTTLDPRPLNNDGFNDSPFYTVVDAPARTYENVLFHDNYFQRLNIIAYGEAVSGAYVRELTYLDGGYGGFAASHSDVHLWYHGTVDLNIPADDSVASITSTERQTWWLPAERNGLAAGFFYSLIGGGDRLSTNRPAGAGTACISDGHNQWWDFGAGTSDNRTALPSNSGHWPNVIKFNLAGTNLMAHGQSNAVTVYSQWVQPSASTATLNICLDDDFNPYNGNERVLRQLVAQGNSPGQISSSTASIDINATNATPGIHALLAKITGGGRSRYLYAPELLTVLSSFQAPTLAIAQSGGSEARVEVQAIAGQRIVLSGTTHFQTWLPLATNWLATNRWSYVENIAAGHRRFYRAAVQ